MVENIFINKKVWANFTDEEMNAYVASVFDHYKSNGFPYYPVDKDWRNAEYKKFISYKKEIITDNVIKQTMHGLALCWSYHPHAFNIQCRNRKTPLETYLDDESLLKVIKKRIKHGDNMSDSGIRKTVKIYTGTQGVSNFRPSAARAIYNMFANNGNVWDMSTGFGGRLLGFLDSSAKSYVGTDPMQENYTQNKSLSDDFAKKDKHVELLMIGSEDYLPQRDSLDLAFTSPPYFDIEKYSNEPTQSYIKFPTRDLWINGFLSRTIENAVYGLKNGGYLILNVNKDLEEDVVKLGRKMNLKLLKTMKLSLSKINGHGFKYEPVIVFMK